MQLTRYEFELLAYYEREGQSRFSPKVLSDTLRISQSALIEAMESLLEKAALCKSAGGAPESSEAIDSICAITEEGQRFLEPYRVKRAVIFAAGFGKRMVPVTLDTPKPMVSVLGRRIMDTLLDALLAAGIDDITIVRGYKKECFDELLEKYPGIAFVDNDIYDRTNNISSAMAALDKIDACYICEADFFITNPAIIRRYHYTSNYLGSYSVETDDWCFDLADGHISGYRKGGTNCFNAYGISFWTKEDCIRLREDIKACWESEGGQDIFWEFVPLVQCSAHFKPELTLCQKTDIVEIDNFSELVRIDPSYKDYESKGERS